jgi:iron only hydrogenase large subunit-like protein
MDALALIAGALRQIGVEAVYDTSFTADLTVMEEAHELIQRLNGGGPLPMFTSCSPAWIRFVELHRPQFLPNLSTCKSPQQMAATLIKRRGNDENRSIYSIAIMPCTAKKHEALEVGDLDAVLTTRELIRLLDHFGVNLSDNSAMRAELDEPFAEASGAGRLFGGSGGVLEAALRTAAHMLGASGPFAPSVLTPLRSDERIRMFSVTLGDKELRCGVVSGLGAAKSLLDQIEAGKIHFDFVEVMSCAGGCVGGGGQPRSVSDGALQARRAKIIDADKRAKLHCAHENPAVQQLYKDLLIEPGSAQSHKLLHRRYINREVR